MSAYRGEHPTRLRAHRYNSRWYWDIATITLEHFATFEEALSAEKMAIIQERPLFNVSGAPCPPRPKAKIDVRKRKSYEELWGDVHAAFAQAMEP